MRVLNNHEPLPIERTETPSVEEFEDKYARLAKPVLISGVVSKWKACSCWNADYFNSFAADKVVSVKQMQNGSYVTARNINMKLSEYLEKANSPPEGQERIYLSETPVKSIFPEILDDLAIPQYVKSRNVLAVMYLGNDVHSQLHFHSRGKALLCMVSGKKRVKIFSPKQTPYLYQKFNFSRIEGEPVDIDKFPLYQNAEYYEVDVNTGEMLFIPIYWWHGVETIGFSCAVVFFWDDDWKTRYFPPSGIPFYYGPLLNFFTMVNKSKRTIKEWLSS